MALGRDRRGCNYHHLRGEMHSGLALYTLIKYTPEFYDYSRGLRCRPSGVAANEILPSDCMHPF